MAVNFWLIPGSLSTTIMTMKELCFNRLITSRNGAAEIEVSHYVTIHTHCLNCENVKHVSNFYMSQTKIIEPIFTEVKATMDFLTKIYDSEAKVKETSILHT